MSQQLEGSNEEPQRQRSRHPSWAGSDTVMVGVVCRVLAACSLQTVRNHSI
jgi:hypothetical protein